MNAAGHILKTMKRYPSVFGRSWRVYLRLNRPHARFAKQEAG